MVDREWMPSTLGAGRQELVRGVCGGLAQVLENLPQASIAREPQQYGPPIYQAQPAAQSGSTNADSEKAAHSKKGLPNGGSR